MVLPLRSALPLARERIDDIALVAAVLVARGKRLAIPQLREIGFVEPEIARAEHGAAGGLEAACGGGVGMGGGGGGDGGVGGHFLAGFVRVPFLAVFLPFDQGVDFGDGGAFVDLPHIHAALEEGVHVQFPAGGAEAQEFEDVFEPGHERGEEPVVVDMYFVHEFVEVVFVPRAQVDEALHGLVWVRGDVLPLRGFEHAEHVVRKIGEVGHGGVDVGGFVYAHERFVEDGEEVAEEVQRYGFFDYREHHRFVALPCVHL